MTHSSTQLNQSPARRDDILVSVCFSDLPATEVAIAETRALIAKLETRFRFHEIVMVVEETAQDAFLQLVHETENVRLFVVRSGMSVYRKRVIAADEAIGDIVLLANSRELTALDPVAMIEQAAEGQAIVSLRSSSSSAEKALAVPLVVLGKIAGFKAGARELQTIALPSALLNQILAHPHPELALRFPPLDPRLPLSYVFADPDVALTREKRELQRRLETILKLLVQMAPSLLVFVTLASILLTLLGSGFALYVFFVWMFVAEIEPGWTTLSMMLSLCAVFLGVSILGLSLGLQNLWGQLSRESFDSVAREINRIDLFEQVAEELNVDLERDENPPEKT